jgi:hypothetical protein
MPEHHTFPGLDRVRSSGAAGILGALALLVGDLLFTAGAGSQDLVLARAQVPETQQYTSGLLGLAAAWLYAAAAWQVHFALRPAGQALSAATLATFAATLIGSAVYHAVFPAVMFGARVSALAGEGSDVAELALTLPDRYNSVLLAAAVIIPSILFTLLYASTVLVRRTYHPRWLILLSPLMIVLIYLAVTQVLSSMAPSIFSPRFYGMMYNVGTLLFFVASTFSLLSRDRWKDATV